MVNWFLRKILRQFNRERIVITTNGVVTIGYHFLKINLDSYFKLHENIKSKWVIDLNVSARRKYRSKSLCLQVTQRLLNFDTKNTINIKKLVNQVIKINNFHTSKDINATVKRHATYWEKMYVNHISNKRLVGRICKEIL